MVTCECREKRKLLNKLLCSNRSCQGRTEGFLQVTSHLILLVIFVLFVKHHVVYWSYYAFIFVSLFAVITIEMCRLTDYDKTNKKKFKKTWQTETTVNYETWILRMETKIISKSSKSVFIKVVKCKNQFINARKLNKMGKWIICPKEEI